MPFEEDAQNPQIWFVDHSYMENMFAMFRKVNGMSIALATPLLVHKIRKETAVQEKAKRCESSSIHVYQKRD